ncbi:hypothetical protein ACWKTZ_24360 [Bacillus cereus]
MKTEQILKRMNDVNELIKLISSLDRRFFYSQYTNQISYFSFDTELFYVDSYSGKKLYITDEQNSPMEGFNGGGTLWDLVKSFRKFIVTGEKGFLGGFKETWAYSYESTMKARQKAKEIGFIDKIDYPYAIF